jgi:PAS domain S-box-containing protein
MLEEFHSNFGTLAFIPHGHCYLWKPGLVWLHVLSDGLIALAYFAISLALIYFTRQYRDLPYPRIFQMFGAFIVACGLTHIMEIWTLWHPTYWVSGALKFGTALVSLTTVSALIPVIPQALTLSRYGELEVAKVTLEEQVRDRTQSLQLSEERLQLALEGSGDGLWDWNICTGEVYLSPRWQEMLGYEAGELAGHVNTWQTLIHPEDQPQVNKLLDRHMRNPQIPYAFDYRLQTKSGEWKWMGTYGKIVAYDVQGQPTRMAGTHKDISDRKQAEADYLQTEILRLELTLLENILEVILAGYWDWNIPNNEEYLSHGFKRMFGYEDDELPNSPESWQSLIFAEDLPNVLECLDRHVQSHGEVPYSNEVRYCHKNGSTVWVSCCGQVIEWDQVGNPIRMIGCHIDITVLKQAEERLRKSDTHLKTAQRIGKLGSWEFDLQTNQITWSDEVFRIFGRDPATEPPNFDELQQLFHPEDRDFYQQMIQTAIATAQPYDVEYRIYHPDGNLVYIQAKGEPTLDAEGVAIQLTGTVLDITDRKRAEADLLRTTAQLADSNRELEAFAYSVSHDLRSPLRAIDGFSKALLEDYGDQVNEEGKNYFDRIRHNVQRMGMLIDDLLNLSRISRSKIRRVAVNLSTLVQEQLDELQDLEPERQIEFVIAPEAIVSADLTLMQVVISNLLANAWKFTSHHATARIEFGMIAQEEQVIHFVRDDGAGFDMTYSSMLFGVFQRLHDTHEFPGTGIGLATVQRAIYRHGGQVWAEAAIEQGATIYFTIPNPSIPSPSIRARI